jgi:hypothetical protein
VCLGLYRIARRMAKITEAGAAPDTSVVWRWGSREEGETGNLGGGNQSSRRRANGGQFLWGI